MTRPTRTMALALAALAVALVAAACGGGDDAPGSADTSGAAGIEDVTVILDWFPNADHMGLYGAIDQGYFAEEGLDVEPVQPSDPAAALKQVGRGRAPFAISYEPEVLLARAQGVPVKAVGAIAVHPLNSVIVRADREIDRPRDLEGKTVGATGLPSDRALLDTVVGADGGDPDRVRVSNVGFNLSPALAAGRVDALIGAYWNIEVPEIEDKGVDVEVFRLEDSGVPDYDELVVVTSDDVARERPGLVRRFLAALRRGQDWAGADQAGATDAVVAANADLDRDLVLAQARLTAPIIAPDDKPTLALDPAAWRGYAAWMRENGLLRRDVDVEAAVTDEFLPPPEEG